MAEIVQVPWNGLRVISTFSGCGGSCLGYLMAGYQVLWANEFIPAAQATYRANHPETYLDTRDIRTIQPQDILDQCGFVPGELDLFDGSPPCASFSTAGKRARAWGQVKAYSDTRQRTDDLFFEYARLLKGLQPKVFVAENVSGLVKGVAKGYFKDILRTLKGCGYRVEARLLDAQWLGVPQMRQRLFFVGVREDLQRVPVFPVPLPYRYSVRDALGIGLQSKSYHGNAWTDGDAHAATIQASGQYWIEHACGFDGHRPYSADGPMRTIQADRQVVRIESRNGKYIGTEHVARTIRASDGGRSCTTLENDTGYVEQADGLRRKFTIAELKRICAFPDDFILTGSYAQQWERLGRAVPPIMMQHLACAIRDHILLPLREGVAV